MNMEFRRKLPIPKEIKEMYPINEAFARLRAQKDKEVKDILSGQDDRLLLLVGPCSADNETAVLDYLTRLRKTADEVAERILIVPRVYTSKPRTTGIGYKGCLLYTSRAADGSAHAAAGDNASREHSGKAGESL